MSEEIPVRGGVLRWARQRGGFSWEDIAKKFKKDIKDIEAWESDKSSSPTYVQLEHLADLYKRPVALFFLPEPPDEQEITKDFRTLPGYELDSMSPKLLYLCRKAKVFPVNLQELFN